MDYQKWRVARFVRAQHAGALGHESLTRLVRERDNDGVVLMVDDERQWGCKN
jgi:hypothetical protein